MTLSVASSYATPWFPDDASSLSADPCLVTTGSRGHAGLLLRRFIRDADHYAEEPTGGAAAFDPLELQDDSFVNFSVGNFDKKAREGDAQRSVVVQRITARSSHRSSHRSSSQESGKSSRRWRMGRKGGSRPLLKKDTFFMPVMRCFV
ncbi:unnamed protein product [Chondrus crispus]|uniref:Uncharacterized protein n=1 Tax=Chondrus crispus TaxID=2769 RepID=R7QSH0_CHOCR|nr:unnamed protein product [Chondrus crispus]CDF41064.1 unnamed protein product [Chondrus crispus]|eukprot:XP_005711358.1 unnamed protein product [Chondrus crispus]